jgi:hypothetical protein
MPGTTPIVNDLLEIRTECFHVDQASINVLHYVVTATAGGGLTVTQIAAAFDGRVGLPYQAWFPAAVFFEKVSCKNLSPPATLAAEFVAHAPGTAVGGVEPGQVSGLITKKTGLAGVRQRGRIYVGFVSTNSVDTAGNLTGGGLAVLTSIRDAIGPNITLVNGAATVTLALAIVHGPDKNGNPPPTQLTLVTTLTPSAFLATQRRRGNYGRRNLP